MVYTNQAIKNISQDCMLNRIANMTSTIKNFSSLIKCLAFSLYCIEC